MGERIVAIIPIRSLRNGKTRLSPVLDLDAREALLQQTARRVVDAARYSDGVATVLVVSPELETLDWAAGLGPDIVPLSQPRALPGLNGAIEAGRNWALAEGAGAMLSLFADLPLVTPDDIRGLTARPEPLVLGPDRRGEGTNALLLRLAGTGSAFRFAFGEGSLARHLQEARHRDLDVAIHTAPGIGFDLDTPDDWSEYVRMVTDCVAAREPELAPCGAGIG